MTRADRARTITEMRAASRARLADWCHENIYQPIFDLCDRAGLEDVQLQVHPFDFEGRGEPMSFKVVGCTVAKQPVLNWIDAEYLRHLGVSLEYRDGGAFHREIEWHQVDGVITEHCSDFEFRVAIKQPEYATS